MVFSVEKSAKNVATTLNRLCIVVITSDSKKVLDKIGIPELKEGQKVKSLIWDVPDIFRLDVN